MKVIAQVLEILVGGDTDTDDAPTYAVFIDFMSLPQGDNLGRRTEAEATLYKRAMDDMQMWQDHPHGITRLTDAPGTPGNKLVFLTFVTELGHGSGFLGSRRKKPGPRRVTV